MISGEYAVLDGAEALAVPTKLGQDLVVKEVETNVITWRSFDVDHDEWYLGTFTVEEVLDDTSHHDKITATLWGILKTAHDMNPHILKKGKGFDVSTHLTFDRKWGLGTSSTLINNIAQWFDLNAFELLKRSFGGSGYDIACAQSDKPVFYHIKGNKPQFNQVDFNPSFKENLFFVYLNQKRDSKEAIQSYRQLEIDIREVQKITDLTRSIYFSETLEEFEHLIHEHEDILSNWLKTATVKESLFSDYSGEVKSLGAWGGDFVLVTGTEQTVKTYFESKGYRSIIAYQDMVI